MRQQHPFTFLRLAALAVTLACACTTALRAQEPDTGDALRIGNERFRAGDFAAALDAYSDALTTSEDSTLIFFNIGASHYRLGQYDQAAQAFEAASENPRLAAISHYNLGLVARRQNNLAAARRWFTLAREEAANSGLSDRAAAALEELDGQPIQPQEQAGGVLSTQISARIGYDTNPFRSPSDSYIDLSQPDQPLIVPVEQSGFYIPLRIDADYFYPLDGDRALIGSYALRSDKYIDSALQPADRTVHRIAAGAELPLGASSSHRLTALGVYRHHDETNFDRDDGLERISSGQSIADRYDYGSVGLESTLEGVLGRLTYGIDLRIENRDYEDTQVVTEYDHDYASLTGEINFPLSSASVLSARYGHYTRDYSDRRARDLDGNSSAANPTLEYIYDEYRLELNYRFSSTTRGQIRYTRTDRSDEFVGYNDYSEDGIRFYLSRRFNDRLRVQFGIEYSDRAYPRAYAFDEPTEIAKAYDILSIGAILEYELSEQLALYAELDADSVGSSDPRGAYDRTRSAFGVTWTCCGRN